MNQSRGEVHPNHLVTCMALSEAGERHYEKVVEDFEQVHESYRRFHPAFVESCELGVVQDKPIL